MSLPAILLFVASAIGGLLWAVLTGLATTEAHGWIPRMSERIIRRASKRLPPAAAPRWCEEAMRHLDEYRDRPISMVLHAVEVARSSRALRRELIDAQPLPEAAPSSWRSVVTGGKERVVVAVTYAARAIVRQRARISARFWEAVPALSLRGSVAVVVFAGGLNVAVAVMRGSTSVAITMVAITVIAFLRLLWVSR